MANPEELAEKILKKAIDALSPVEREMNIMKWSPEFRHIIWTAIALEANRRAAEQSAVT